MGDALNSTDQDRIDRAEEVVRKMTASYLDWVEGDLQKLASAVDGLDTDAPDAISQLEEIYRTAHDIKGQGGSFGYELMTDIGTIMCRHIESIETPKTDDVAQLQACLSAMRMVIGERLAGDGGNKGRDILETLTPVTGEA